jgi:hypothetical protein
MMVAIYWDDIKEGDSLPTIEKIATTASLIRWAGATGDFLPMHFEDTFAHNAGLKGPIVHGALKRQWIIQVVTDWIGNPGFLKRVYCEYRGLDFPRKMKTMKDPVDGETWLCKGLVTKKYSSEKGEYLVDCNIWVENGTGAVTTLGNATVILPRRS